VLLLIQEKINEFIVTKLNLNTKGVEFKSGYIFWIDDGSFKENTQVGYKIESTDFVPVMIGDWNNTSQPYPIIDNQDWVLPISFAIPQVLKDNALESIAEFKTLLQGTEQLIDGYTLGLRIAEPTPPTNPIAHAGSHRIIVDVVLMAGGGKELKYGNSVILNMKKTTATGYTRIIFKTIDILTKTTLVPKTTGYVTTSKKEKSIKQIDILIFYKDALGDILLDELWEDVSNSYDVQVKYSDTKIKNEQMVISSIGQHISAGVALGFNVTLLKG
jgi:hypothetical protein